MSVSTGATVPPPRRFVLASLLCAIGFGLVAMTICLPSMPAWEEVFDATQARVQLSFSSFLVAFGVAQIIFGPLSDRYGRRRLLIVGYALAALASLAAALSTGLNSLILARFIQGTGAAAGMVLGRAMVQDLYSGADRSRVMAYIGMAMGLCAPVATVVGGQLHALAGWRANFVLIAVLALCLLLMTWRALPPDTRSESTSAHWLRALLDAYGQLLRAPAFLAYVAILSLSTGTFYVYLAGAPSVYAQYNVGPREVGFFIMVVPVSYIAGSFITSHLVKHFSDARLMLAGHCVSLAGISLVVVLAVVDVRSPIAIAAPLLLLGLGQGLLMPSTLSGTVSVIPALAGAAAGAAGLAQQLTGAFGGYVIGLFEHDGATNLGLLMLTFMLTAFASQMLLRRIQRIERKRRATE